MGNVSAEMTVISNNKSYIIKGILRNKFEYRIDPNTYIVVWRMKITNKHELSKITHTSNKYELHKIMIYSKDMLKDFTTGNLFPDGKVINMSIVGDVFDIVMRINANDYKLHEQNYFYTNVDILDAAIDIQDIADLHTKYQTKASIEF